MDRLSDTQLHEFKEAFDSANALWDRDAMKLGPKKVAERNDWLYLDGAGQEFGPFAGSGIFLIPGYPLNTAAEGRTFQGNISETSQGVQICRALGTT